MKKEQQDTFDIISKFLKLETTELKLDFVTDDKIRLTQEVDGKSLEIDRYGIEEVLERADSGGHPFLQVNFLSGTKILLTKNLVGFKPAFFEGVGEGRIPNVVTTPDLFSIIEAFSDFDETEISERRALKRMYFAILQGAEAVGFELKNEKLWLSKLDASSVAA